MGDGGGCVGDEYDHRLNMELDLKIYLASMCTAVLIGRDPATLAHIRYGGAIGQPR
jgi:hypothetical protein